MTQFLHAKLVNDIFGDPVLFLDFRFEKRALLFDLGDITTLSARALHRVTHVFVSHTHMDHFGGFDRLLRLCLHRTAPLHFVGPAGFIDRVESKIRAYTWNLLDEGSVDFALSAAEFINGTIARRSLFQARQAFERQDYPDSTQQRPDLVLDEDDFAVRAAILDHGTDCLAFAFEEKLRVNVVREGLTALGLRPGPWLNGAKHAVRLGLDDATPIPTDGEGAIALGLLRERSLVSAPGQKVAYIVDAADHEANRMRMVALAARADQLFIETAFADEDAALACSRRHLTAGAAGRIAREAGVQALIPLHVSARYEDRPQHVPLQAEAAFRRPLQEAWEP